MPRSFYQGMTVMLIVAAAMAGAVGASRSDLAESREFHRETGTLQFALHASVGMASARLRLRISVEGGAVSWTLIDPEGRTHLTGNGDGGQVSSETEIRDPETGLWTLEVRLSDATGHYWLRWKAR